MSQTRHPIGIPTGGQFASSVRSEPTLALDVNQNRRTPTVTAIVEHHIERLIAREDAPNDEVERTDDVEADLRRHFAVVPTDEFNKRFDEMTRIAELISVTERADAYDPRDYEGAAAETQYEPCDFPVQDAEFGENPYDYDEYKARVIESLEDLLHVEAAGLAAALPEDEAVRLAG